ncbi:MAG TPA: hypothetical protein VFQ76_09370, partial [Longimicrobiaceae bacterium]|nr:hypothetical protein [Longimicrobiaceae bacterium]
AKPLPGPRPAQYEYASSHVVSKLGLRWDAETPLMSVGGARLPPFVPVRCEDHGCAGPAPFLITVALGALCWAGIIGAAVKFGGC